MKFTSQLVAAASGSIGGATFSRNRGGQYIRRRAVPSNPNSEAQGIARTNLATAVAVWTNTLSPAQRQGWATYAQSTPVIDAIGNSILLSGQQMFVRSATVALIASLATPNDPPLSSGLGLTPDWNGDPVVDASGQTVAGSAVLIGTTAEWTALVYMSRPVIASRTPAHETRRFAYATSIPDGASTPITGAVPFPVTTGQRVRVWLYSFDATGRLSSPSFRDIVVQA